MRIGCQTYSWEMQLAARPTTLWEMFDAIAACGFEGVEFTNNTGGEWLDQPGRVREELQRRRLELVALTIARHGFCDPNERPHDLALARSAVAFLDAFPGCPLMMAGADCPDRTNWQRPLDRAIAFYREAGALAASHSHRACVHPHSHHGSLLETLEQYDYLFARLPAAIGWCADTGHIVRGGQDLMTCLNRHADRLVYLHLKDVDAAGRWKPLGQGVIDYPRLFTWLNARNYEGWLVAEEESELAWKDPVEANRVNREYLRRTL
jgi:sugar phosphate isomerase/epimerase